MNTWKKNNFISKKSESGRYMIAFGFFYAYKVKNRPAAESVFQVRKHKGAKITNVLCEGRKDSQPYMGIVIRMLLFMF